MILHKFIKGKHDTAIEPQTIGVSYGNEQKGNEARNQDASADGISIENLQQIANEQITSYSGTTTSQSGSPKKRRHRKNFEKKSK